ncbi:amino acid ABC transporter substrate-binding protein [Dyella sp. M7H15-1]|uniref:amino acid ABC transporter substrate-binding protein n=1 Tax=Dyella sp. M7H15-1 TaxID=2501295 RepID=UPI0010051049|nr:amino acid ABC transporter substrate-binding protein [Dyella sp. M7H15-1]QAU22612.1 amino acid ABC transporter substrate-binding protein [Dyella sp. M7H15-1]
MWQTLATFTRHCLTGADNQTYDIGRLLWVLAFMVGMGLAIASFITSRPFDLEHYGLGVGAVLAAGGWSLSMKARTEPKQ